MDALHWIGFDHTLIRFCIILSEAFPSSFCILIPPFSPGLSGMPCNTSLRCASRDSFKQGDPTTSTTSAAKVKSLEYKQGNRMIISDSDEVRIYRRTVQLPTPAQPESFHQHHKLPFFERGHLPPVRSAALATFFSCPNVCVIGFGRR